MAIKKPLMEAYYKRNKLLFRKMGRETHTICLVEYETDLEQYDRKLCPTLERIHFHYGTRNLQEAVSITLSSI